MDGLLVAQIALTLAVPAVLFARPKFIRDYFGDGLTPIVLGIIALIAIAVQIALHL